MPLQVHGFGFNGFQQISSLDEEIITTPTRCLENLNTNNYLQKVILLWHSIAFVNDQDQIQVCGFIDNELKDHIIHQNVSNHEIKSIAFLQSRMGVLLENGEFVLYDKELNISYKLNDIELNVVPNKFDTSKIVFVIGNTIKYLEIFEKMNIGKEIKLKEKVKQLSCGKDHNLLVTESGKVFSWGIGSRGQLGHGDMATVNLPRHVEYLDGIGIKQVECGGWHSVALAETNDIYSWGWNVSGQTGFPAPRDILTSCTSISVKKSRDNASRSVGNGATDDDVDAESSDDGVAIVLFPGLLELENRVSAGKNDFVSVISVSCGTRHTAALLSTDDVLMWGWGKYGQLGSRSTSNKVLHFRHALSVLCGPWNTCVFSSLS